MSWLVDTGASPNVLDRRVYESINPCLRPTLTPASVDLQAAEGSFLKLYGEADFRICLDQREFIVKFVVADLEELKGILGMQFLNTVACTIDVSHGRITINDLPIQMQRSDGPDCCHIRLSQSFTIAPCREHVITGFIDNSKWNPTDSVGVAEAVESFVSQTGLILTNAVVDVSQ